jgi:hypothetical protein
MKTKAAVVALVVFFVGVGVGVGGKDLDIHAFVDGNAFRQKPTAYQAGYIFGVKDCISVFAAYHKSGRGLYTGWHDRSMDMQAPQIRAIVEKYLKDHPEDWNMPMAFIVLSAMKEACEPATNLKK